MDNQTAKHLLSAYRASGADSNDEKLREALEHCQRDPEMSEWLKAELAFDHRLATAMRSIRGPEEGMKAILATAELEPEDAKPSKLVAFRTRWWAALSAAAIIAVSITLWTNTRKETNPFAHNRVTIARLAQNALPLDFRNSDVYELQNWLSDRGAPVPNSIPEAIRGAADAAGCKVFEDANGDKISLFCFRLEDELVHVFVYDSDIPSLPEFPDGEWRRENGWNLYAWSENGNTLALASKIDPAILEELIKQA